MKYSGEILFVIENQELTPIEKRDLVEKLIADAVAFVEEGIKEIEVEYRHFLKLII